MAPHWALITAVTLMLWSFRSQAFLAGPLVESLGKVACLRCVTSKSLPCQAVNEGVDLDSFSASEISVDDTQEGSTNSKRLLTMKELKTGQALLGFVVETTNYAAFVDVNVVRAGTQGKLVPVTGFLHMTDIHAPYALENTQRASNTDCGVVVKKDMHLTAYVKDVFPNSGRLTLSLDPALDRTKVRNRRMGMRAKAHSFRRRRRIGTREDVKEGQLVQGYVTKVTEEKMLVDIMLPKQAVIWSKSLGESLGMREPIADLRLHTKRGDKISARVKYLSEVGDKAYLEFINWGGLSKEESSQEGDGD
ncbi:unnamed protein product [Choristocarpus tenellus]